MGNANGREEGGSQSGVEESGSMADMDCAHGNYPAHGGSEYMVQSPSPCPGASHSLFLRPQMPVVPLQKPDKLHVPSPSWRQRSSGYEGACSGQGIPTMITWSRDGKEVAVEGSWDDWTSRKPLQRAGKDLSIVIVLASGVYRYRFVVDGQWRYSPDQPWEQDESGDAYNILDLQDYVPEDIDRISGFERPQSPDSSYSNSRLGQEDFAKEPPAVPPHLNPTLLNAPSTYHVHTEIPRPQHVLLSHLYMHTDTNLPSLVTLASTNRFLSKYVTAVLYKSLQR